MVQYLQRAWEIVMFWSYNLWQGKQSAKFDFREVFMFKVNLWGLTQFLVTFTYGHVAHIYTEL